MKKKCGSNINTKTKEKRIILKIVCAVVLIYLMAPIVIIYISSFATEDYLTMTPSALSLKWYIRFFKTKGFVNAFINSIKLAILSTLGSLIIGTLSAYTMDKSPKRDILITYFGSPLLIPQIIIGIGMLQMCSLFGFTRGLPVLVAAHIVVGMPYVIRTVTASLYRFNISWEEAAYTLGSNRITTLWDITLPILKPSIIASSCFAFITSFGNLSISSFLTNARVTTLPIQLYAYARYEADPTIAAMSGLSLTITIVLMFIIEKSVGIENMY